MNRLTVKCLLISLLFSLHAIADAGAQYKTTPDYFLDGWYRGMDMAIQLDQQKMQQQRHELEMERLRLQVEREKLELEKQKRSETETGEGAQTLTFEGGLTGLQKEQLIKYYGDKGVKISFGHQLKVIKVYDQGYIFPYEGTVNDKKAVLAFASIYENGNLKFARVRATTPEKFQEIMEKDLDTIQREAVAAFPMLYKVPSGSE